MIFTKIEISKNLFGGLFGFFFTEKLCIETHHIKFSCGLGHFCLGASSIIADNSNFKLYYKMDILLYV